MNSVNIMGRLVNEPELKFTKNQKAVTTIRVAVDAGYATQDGQRQTYFFDVIAWEGTAQFITTWFTKGQMIAVSGKLQTRAWTDRFEQKRVSVEIAAQNVYFCGEKKPTADAAVRAENHSSVNSYGTAGFQQGKAPKEETNEQMRFDYRNDFRPLEDDDDVPF